MSDADRLRQAADRLDGWSMYDWEGDQAYPALDAVAALLRAVADDLEIGLYIVGAESPAAALALADVILGDTDG